MARLRQALPEQARHTGRSRVATGALCVVLAHTISASALLKEYTGNERMGGSPDWPELDALVNHKARAYGAWVNGNIYCHYQGDADALAQALTLFARTKAKARIVFLRPGAESITVDTGRGRARIRIDWQLSIPRSVRRPGAELQEPLLELFVGGGNVDLEAVRFPSGIEVRDANDYVTESLERLTASDAETRALGASVLAGLGPDAAPAVSMLVESLGDDDAHVRNVAATALGRIGHAARAVLPHLQKLAKNDPDEQVRQTAGEAIAEIRTAKPDPQREAARRRITEYILHSRSGPF